ncbi:uncharacterized protein UTRI_02756_B [Ustilago trichophora]|uniref:Uncharacterized protein n=1 Tax=Ustilago trichophora TaxID=86804 RepID=A0A5C3E4W6_9BASI|nr:uncharacterized protein UTRI_02756_B [Ustilago trichophora]
MSSTTKNKKKSDLKGKRKMDASSHSHEEQQDSEARAAQLAQLEAFGNAFMSSFDLPSASTGTSVDDATQSSSNKKLSSKKRKRLAESQAADTLPTEEETSTREQDEMDVLFGTTKPSAQANASSNSKQISKKKVPKSRVVETVVFGGEARPDADELKDAKKGWKAFMSSKIDKIASEDELAAASKLTSVEEEEEKQLVANDRLLSELLSTTLFAPGTGNTSKGKSNLSSNDTISRIMELSATDAQRKGQAVGRGWGENELKRQQLSKAPAAIRQGMRKAAGERRDKEREKAKELGTWHPSLKESYANKATATEMGLKKETRKRQRGLGMGIGKFQGGMLKLSSQEISKVNAKGRGGSSGGRGGKGGKRK